MEQSRPLPRIIPVMDIRGGVVVRAIAGRREEYKPLVSRLTNSTDPIEVAEVLRGVTKTNELYVADLDAILGSTPRFELFRELERRGFAPLVDAGVRTHEEAGALFEIESGVDAVVLGLETLQSPRELGSIVRDWCPIFQLVLSMDLRGGSLLGEGRGWPQQADDLVNWCAGQEVRRFLILDLARVGVGSGTGTLDLCRSIKARYGWLEHFEVIAGGGVRGPEDLPALAEAGVDAVLIASALHDGKFGLPGSHAL